MTVKHNQPVGLNTRLYDAWLKSGLEITELSKKSGVARSSVYGYLYNGQCPNITSIAKIARVLGVSLDYLVYG